MGVSVERLIGIDFGTSTSVIKTKRYQDGQPLGDSYLSAAVTFGNGAANAKAVTAVRRNSDGSLSCGIEAEEQLPDSELFLEFKMDLESADPEKRQSAQELTEAYFQYLYEWYDHQRTDLGELGDEERTLVSYPVKWREETRQFMIHAAEAAGFKNVTSMDEPTAALYATLCRKMEELDRKNLLRIGEPGYLLLVDMGAGTTDLAVCRYTISAEHGQAIRTDQITNEIVVTWPEQAGAPTFGGREVDRILEKYVADYCIQCALPEGIAWQLVKGSNATKVWKEMTVSRTLNEGGQVSTCSFVSTMVSAFQHNKPFPAFGRGEFEQMLGEKLEQFKTLVAGCLNKASEIEPEILAKGLDLVILTGGHSSWYFTEELLNGTMQGLQLPQLERVQAEKERVIRLSNPQETVALGLVYSKLPFQIGRAPETSAYCWNCGKKIPASNEYCYYCGTQLNVEEDDAGGAERAEQPDMVFGSKQPDAASDTAWQQPGDGDIPGSAEYADMPDEEDMSDGAPLAYAMVSWYPGEVTFGVPRAAGTLRIYADRVDLKKKVGATGGNKVPLEISMREIADVREGRYSGIRPALFLTLKDGRKHTFAGAANRGSIQNCIQCIRNNMR